MKIRSILFWIVALCVLLSACGQTPAPTADTEMSWQEQYDLGVRYLEEGNYEEAILAFSAAIEIDPRQAEAYVGRGDAYVAVATAFEIEDGDKLPSEAQEACEQALASYLKALELDGSMVEVYHKTAEVYEHLGDLEKAVAILQRGIDETGDSGLQDYQDQLNQELSTKYVLIRQDMYYLDMHDFLAGNNHFDEDNYYHDCELYSYDNQGYQLTRDFWSEDGTHWYNVTWSYDEAGQYWVKTETTDGEPVTTEVLHDRISETIEHMPSMSYDDIYALYTDPFGKSEPEEGYTAKYTYDENGNITRIDTFAPDGRSPGWCDFTWAELSADQPKFNSKDFDQLCELIVAHYTELWQPSGEYTCFASEVELSDDAYVFILRYAMSDEEAEAIIEGGGFPTANRYVQTVSVNYNTGEVTDELTDTSWIATLQ